MHDRTHEIPYSVSPNTDFETDLKLIVKCHRVAM